MHSISHKSGSERFLRALLERAGESVTVLDAAGTVLFSTPQEFHPVELTEADLLGKNIFEMIHPDDRDRAVKLFEELLQQPGNSVRVELRVRGKGDLWLWMDLIATNLLDDPAVGGVVINSRDITRHKQAEEQLRESEERYRLLVEVMPHMAAYCNPHGEVLFLNERWYEYTGQTEPEAIGNGWLEAVHPEDRPRVVAEVQRALRVGDVFRSEYRIRRALDHEYRWHITIALPVRNSRGEIIAWIASATDIENQKRAQQVLETDKQELEKRVAERTAQLQETNRILSALTESSKAMLHAADERNLLQTVCRIVANTRGNRMTWIGLAQHDDAKSVLPAAVAGVDRGYLRDAHVSWSDQTARGRGPVGTAIRTGQTVYCRDLRTDRIFRPWRQAALKRGYASCLALPLTADGQTFGALSIYTTETDAFDREEQQLLKMLADELAFGISALRARETRERLERELLDAGEHERRRIGHDLHDGLGQQLAGIAFLASALPVKLEKLAPEVAADAQRIAALLEDSIHQVRALSRGLHPILPDDHSLMSSLRELAETVEATTGVACRWECPKPVLVRDHRTALNIYRIAQEAIHNALKHGKPRHIWIRLRKTGPMAALSIKDDGTGPCRQAASSKGMGLHIMKYRAGLIGAEWEFSCGVRCGSIVTCRWKLPAPAKKGKRRSGVRRGL
jgi:PAS domain S-box-containing protein